MIDSIHISTNGKPIKNSYSRIANHPQLDVEMANLYLQIDDTEVQISFETWDEMIEFCKEHNFKYRDCRNTPAKS